MLVNTLTPGQVWNGQILTLQEGSEVCHHTCQKRNLLYNGHGADTLLATDFSTPAVT